MSCSGRRIPNNGVRCNTATDAKASGAITRSSAGNRRCADLQNHRLRCEHLRGIECDATIRIGHLYQIHSRTQTTDRIRCQEEREARWIIPFHHAHGRRTVVADANNTIAIGGTGHVIIHSRKHLAIAVAHGYIQLHGASKSIDGDHGIKPGAQTGLHAVGCALADGRSPVEIERSSTVRIQLDSTNACLTIALCNKHANRECRRIHKRCGERRITTSRIGDQHAPCTCA